jgi:hypothetical protein
MDERTESRVLFLISAALAIFGIFAPLKWHDVPPWITNSALVLALFLAIWAVGLILPAPAKGAKKLLAAFLIAGGITVVVTGIVLYLDVSPSGQSVGVLPPPVPNIAPALLRVPAIEFFPPKDGAPAKMLYAILNVGAMSASHILKQPGFGFTDGSRSSQKEDELFAAMGTLPPLQADGGNEFQTGQGAKFWFVMDRLKPGDYEKILAGQGSLYTVFRIAYRDEATPPGKRRVTEVCRYYSGSLEEWHWCDGHNRTYLSD